jgi:hypothetical protein
MAKEGSTVSGLMDSLATMTSLSLQYGVPLRDLVNKFAHVRFEPAGFTANQEIPIAKSIVDYVFRWLGSKFLTGDDRAVLGLVDRTVTDEHGANPGGFSYDAAAISRLAAEAEPGDPAVGTALSSNTTDLGLISSGRGTPPPPALRPATRPRRPPGPRRPAVRRAALGTARRPAPDASSIPVSAPLPVVEVVAAPAVNGHANGHTNGHSKGNGSGHRDACPDDEPRRRRSGRLPGAGRRAQLRRVRRDHGPQRQLLQVPQLRLHERLQLGRRGTGPGHGVTRAIRILPQ